MTNLKQGGKDEDWMRLALEEARQAGEMDEVPIGAIAVVGEQCVARAHNIREATGNPLGHAEILLIQKLTSPLPLGEGQGEGAARSLQWRLTDVTIYVTCEPCLMCAGAMLQARIPRVVFGCHDPKAGVRLNHRIQLTGGILAPDCGQLLSDFFRVRRK